MPATRAEIARLFGRAAFGATAAELDQWSARPYEEAVEHLLAVPALDSRTPAFDEERRVILEQMRGTDPNSMVGAANWWLERMRQTPYPLEERMTLLWHGHFATAVKDPQPDAGLLAVQNQTMRRHALGNFRALSQAMTIDLAMLYWLNGTDNAIPFPNENYARELFELFILGKNPQPYAEGDVREAARVLTGWVAERQSGLVRFANERHDHGVKHVLGATIGDEGNAEYQHLIDVALAHAVAPRFIASRLVTNLAYVPGRGAVAANTETLVARVADTLRKTDWDLKAALRTLFLADEFRRPDIGAGHQLVRPPAQVVVAACRAFNVSPDNDQVSGIVGRMGQRLFDPPNVGGWPTGTGWLSPVTVLAHYEWAALLYQLWAAIGPFGGQVALPPADDLGAWAARLGLAGFSPTTRAAVDQLLAALPKATDVERQQNVFQTLLMSPDWMVI